MGRKHALITGGAGFVGSHLTDQLIERGFEVTLYDNLLPQVHREGLVDAEGWPIYLNKDARKIKGDIRSDKFKESLNGVTHLVHLAASVGVGQSMSNIVDYTNNNVMTAAHVLEALSKGGHTIQRIAVASSMSIYGEGEYFSQRNNAAVAPPPREIEQLKAKQWELTYEGEELIPIPTKEEKPLRPASIYAINKRDHEEMFLVVGRALGIPTIALRLFNIYGSRQALSNPYTGVAAIFISRLMNDLPPLVFEDGKQMRDFVHVNDVARAFATVLESDKQIWDMFNVGSGNPLQINAIALLLAICLGKKIEPEILNSYRIGDIRHCFADISKIEKVFGFKPKKKIDEGMKELIEWVQKCPKPVVRTEESLTQLKQNNLIV